MRFRSDAYSPATRAEPLFFSALSEGRGALSNALSSYRLRRSLRDMAMISVFALPALALGEEQTEDSATAQARARDDAKNSGAPKAKSLGKDVAGVFVNASVADSGYSPGFVMRGFPGGLTLFDGAAHGFSTQDVAQPLFCTPSSSRTPMFLRRPTAISSAPRAASSASASTTSRNGMRCADWSWA
ncbi:hypothetical protein [Methylosinus sporium]|uniref:hypothetical protein n=2 Tax=Methylosinus TaxID=425 RepID=UPI0031BA0FFA